MILQLILLAGIIFRCSDGTRSDNGDQVMCSLGSHHAGDGIEPLTGYKPGEKKVLECQPGYYFDRISEFLDYGDETETSQNYLFDRAPREIICQNDGRWNRPVPTCHAFTCPRPSDPPRGTITPKDQTMFQANDTIKYQCRKGTVLLGMSSKQCDMSWNGWSFGDTPPVCEAVRCPVIEPPIGGWTDHRVHDVGSTVRFFCNRGQQLYGSANVTCQPNGRWTGAIPLCIRHVQEQGCNRPLIPAGSRITERRRELGAEVRYACFNQNFLNGPAKRTCGPLGWSPSSEPECEALFTFDNLDDLARTFASIVERFSSGEEDTNGGFPRRRYDLYFLFDSSHSVPKGHFKFAKKLVESLIDQLTVSQESDGTAIGLLSFSIDAEREFARGGGIHAHPSTPITELRKKLIDLKYFDRDTNITGALEFVRKVMIPVSASRRQDVPKVVFLFSDGDVTHGGSPIRSAQALKDLGVEIFTIHIGTVHNKKTRSILRGVSSNDRFPKHYPHFLKMRKDRSVQRYMVENFRSHLTAGVLHPEYPVCGLAGDINFSESYNAGGDAANSTSWPWIMAINKIGQGNKAEFLCTGTLISEQWVLTSAQCVKEEGVTFLVTSATSPDKFDGGMVMNKFINGTTESDIALLKLHRPIRLGPYVRPICLPKDSAQLDDRFGDFAVTTGWNLSDDGKPKLFQAAIPILRDGHCRGESPAAGYCAGLKTTVNGTCPQDMGSPLMIRSKLDRSTRARHWILTGVAWQDDGCTATGGNSGRFVRLERYLGWIRRTMDLVLVTSNNVDL